MFTRPARRVESIAQSAAPGSAHYLIACSGVKDDAPCCAYILISPATKSECPACGKLYPAGFLSHIGGPISIEKAP